MDKTTSEPPERVAEVGDVLLLCMQESPLVLRPFIVCAACGKVVGGQLLYAGEDDRALPWVQLWAKHPPAHDVLSCWVTAYKGHTLGSWRFKGEVE